MINKKYKINMDGTFLIKSRGGFSQTPWITTKKKGIHAFVGYILQLYISCGHFFKNYFAPLK